MVKSAGFVVLAHLRAHAGAAAELLEEARAHAERSLTREPGCLQFDIVVDPEDPERLVFYEVFKDAAAFDAHQASPHLAAWRERSEALIAERRLERLDRAAHPAKPLATEGTGAGKVLVAAANLKGREHLLQPLVAHGLEIVMNPHDRPLREAELVALLPGCVATVAGAEPYNDKVLATAPQLRVVARLGVGYDQIDVAAATRHHTAIAMAFGTNHEAVADLTLMLMLALSHRLEDYRRRLAEGGWGTMLHARLHGTTVGLIGFGRIGRAVAKRCQGFNAEVLVADPIMDAETVARLGCRLVEHDELIGEADFVSLHCPLGPTTRNLIDARRLALMKPSAFLINTARGGVVDETALLAALQEGRIAGAGLDVFEREPPGASPLLAFTNVVATPHVAGVSAWSLDQMARRAVDSILTVLRGEDPGSGLLLNPEVLTGAPV